MGIAAPGSRSRTFRLFVSSTFQDLRAERNALHAHVFPRLRELCSRHGCGFQAIDLRWGVSGEAARDQQTMIICLREIERCHRVTPRPNFLVLLGDRHGWRPPPPRIPAAEFDALLAHMPGEDAALVCWRDEQPSGGKGWYRRDDNASPAEYRLLPRHVDYSAAETSEQRDAARQAEGAAWSAIEARLQHALKSAAGQAKLAPDALVKYERSATAQEIIAGALSVADPGDKVSCFLRSIEGARDTDGRLVDAAEGYIDVDPRPITALKAELRERLAGHPEAVTERRARWTSHGPSADHIGILPANLDHCLALLDTPQSPPTLCGSVWRRLARTILLEIGHPTVTTAGAGERIHLLPDEGLDGEGRAHCEFANGLLRIFVGREAALRAIREYVSGEGGRPLAVVAPGGAGKSAVMAKALEEAKAAHPTAQVVYRFIGATPSSSDGRSLLASLCREINRRYGGAEAVPSGYTELVPELEKRMAWATPGRPLVLFLDALDQLSVAHEARGLAWLPRRIPPNVRVVLSTRTEAETLAAVARLEPERVELGRMSRAEGGDLLGLWLRDAGRTLTPGQRAAVLDAFEAEASGGRPLYLKLAFEEARLWPSYVAAGELTPGIEGVIRQDLFRRLASDDHHGEELVARAVGYIAASRDGLAEEEALDVLSRDVDLYESFLRGSFHLPSDVVGRAVEYRRTHALDRHPGGPGETRRAESWLGTLIANHDGTSDLHSFLEEVLARPDGPRLPVVLWSRLFFDLAPYLTERMGDTSSLLAFYHRELGEAGAAAFAAGERGRTLHGRLADYFRSRADPAHDRTWTGRDVRGLSELPYHLTEAARWQDLDETLTDFRFLEHKAAEVGVEVSRGGGREETLYAGVFRLQHDFDHALRSIPRGGVAGPTREPLIVTAVDLGSGYVIRCPWCTGLVPFRDEWLGQQMPCPAEHCGAPWKVNPFVSRRPAWQPNKKG